MPELRFNIATRDWVIIATERAKRPDEFKLAKKEEKELPAYSPDCPFCPGSEEKAGKPSAVIKDEKGNWLVKVVPNKFPALCCIGEPDKTNEGVYHSINGVGVHEVIIESPRHNMTTALYDVLQIENIIKIYKQRYLDLSKDSRLKHIIIFKNHGLSAGTSLEHPHSQLIATPIVPAQVAGRLRDAKEYRAENGECVYCKMVKEEIKAKKRVVVENKNFISFALYASFSPFHTWILPKKHKSSFGEIDDAEIKDLALILKETLAKLYYGLGNPDYNYCIRSSPFKGGENNYFHWYIAVIPRITKPAGFEVGSGMFINTSLPEQCAKFLREIN